MKGTSKVRQQGYGDPLLVEVMKRHGLDEIPLYTHRPPETEARRQRWFDLGKVRDGEVAAEQRAVDDPAAMAAEIKAMAKGLGASAVGIAKLTPIMIDEAAELTHDSVICAIVGENYEEALNGPRAIETESTRTYVRCAEISTEMAKRIRAWGYPAVAHHNGGCDIQAIPAMYAAGLGELGKHGSMINRTYGSSFRLAMVTTNMPLIADRPDVFGGDMFCESCQLCSNACPPDAIHREKQMVRGEQKWYVDFDKCVPYFVDNKTCGLCLAVCPWSRPGVADNLVQKMAKRMAARQDAPSD